MPRVDAWSGVFGGSVTPFTDEGNIDWESLEKHLDALTRSSLQGIFVNASIGEGPHLLPDERHAILKAAVRQIGDEVPVLDSIHASNTREAAEASARAAGADAQGLLIFPHPSFAGQPLDPEVPAEYYREIARASGLPLVVFRTMPGLGVIFDIDVLKRLAEIEGVVAIKEGTWDRDLYAEAATEFVGEDSPVALLADADSVLLDFLRLGAHGTTVASAVIDSDRWISLFEARGSTTAEEIQRSLTVFADAVFAPPFRNFRARLKEALRIDGIIKSSHVRPPLPPLTEIERQEIALALAGSRGEVAMASKA